VKKLWRAEKEGDLTYGVASCELPANENAPDFGCFVALSRIGSGHRGGIRWQVVGIFGQSVMQKHLLQAINLALDAKWDAAHEMVQKYETDTTAAWIHAVLHKIEGDDSNSWYWYRRAGKLEHVSDEPTAELAEIRREVEERP
jgi:hypothetical protein